MLDVGGNVVVCSVPARREFVGIRGVDVDIENGPNLVERTCPSEDKDEPDPDPDTELPEF